MPIKMTPEEIQAEINLVSESAKRLGYMSQGMQDALKDAEVGIRGYTQSVREREEALLNGLKGLGSSMLGYAQGIAEGKTGQSAYNSALQASGDAAASMASQIPGIGFILSAVIKVLTFGATEATKMADTLYKTNQDLNKVGAIGAGGMTEIFGDMQKFGYGINEIGDMTNLITKNAQSLALFGGTAEQGTKTFANISSAIQHSDLQRQFMNMGMSVNDINNGIAGYITLTSNLGVSQKLTTRQLVEGSEEYLNQQARLSKLTGQNADQLQRQQEKLEAIDSLQAALSREAERGPEGLAHALKVQEAIKIQMSKSEDFGIALAQMYSGIVPATKEANAAILTSGGAIYDFAEQLRSSNLDVGKFGEAVSKNAKAQLPFAISVQTLPGAGKDLISMIQQLRLAHGPNAEAYDKVVKSLTNAKEGADGLTNEQTKLIEAQMAARDSLQSLTFKIIPTTTSLFNSLNDVLDKVLGMLPDSLTGRVSGSSYFSGSDTQLQNVLTGIRAVESGSEAGDYTAKNPKSTASGAYQMLDSTWQAATKKYGQGEKYKRMSDAPSNIQDEVAAKFVKDLLEKNKGNLDATINEYFTGNPKGNLTKEQLEANSGLDASGYLNRFHQTYDKKQPGTKPNTEVVPTTPSNTPPVTPKNNYEPVVPSTDAAASELPSKTKTFDSKTGYEAGGFEDILAQQKAQNDLLEKQLRLHKDIAHNTNPN